MNPLLTRSYENIGRARHTNQSSCCVFIVNLHFNTQRLHIFSPSVSTIWRCVHVCMFMCAIFCFISSPSIFLLRFTCTQQYWVRINHNHIPVQLIQKTHWWPFLMLLSALTFSTHICFTVIIVLCLHKQDKNYAIIYVGSFIPSRLHFWRMLGNA